MRCVGTPVGHFPPPHTPRAASLGAMTQQPGQRLPGCSDAGHAASAVPVTQPFRAVLLEPAEPHCCTRVCMCTLRTTLPSHTSVIRAQPDCPKGQGPLCEIKQEVLSGFQFCVGSPYGNVQAGVAIACCWARGPSQGQDSSEWLSRPCLWPPAWRFQLTGLCHPVLIALAADSTGTNSPIPYFASPPWEATALKSFHGPQ